MAPLPKTQKSLLLNTTTLSLSLDNAAPLPPPSALQTEHLIHVHSTAITPGELTWGPFITWPSTQTPCYDVSGTVLTAVPHSPFSPGEKIYGRVMANRPGTARQYATILPSEAARVPRGVGMVEAAGLPMSMLTAWQAVFEKGELAGSYEQDALPYIDEKGNVVGGQANGKRLLVLGASGSVGRMAVQFGKLAGAYVVGTASTANTASLQELGIDEVVDYHKVSMAEWVGGDVKRKFDVVFACVSGEAMRDGWSAVREDGGVYVSVSPGFEEPVGGKPEGVKGLFFIMESRGEELRRISRLVEKGVVRGLVDSVWRVEEFEEAFEKVASGKAKGKVVFKMVEDGE